MLKVVRPPVPVQTLAPLVTYTRDELLFAVRFAEVVGPFYLAPVRRDRA